MTRLWHGWRKLVALSLALALGLALVACAPIHIAANGDAPTATPIGQIPRPNAGASGAPTTTPPASRAARPLPAFTDWRVAYVAADGRLHAVSLDGGRDVAGSALGFSGVTGMGVWAAGVAPDGKTLAYLSDGGLTVINAATGAQRETPSHTGDSRLWWSPDQRYLALTGAGAVLCARVSDGSTFSAPRVQGSLPQLLVSGPFGWLDATHVAVNYLPASTATQAMLQSLDVTTGALRPIATVQADPGASFAVTPDGAHTLMWTAKFRANPYTPQAGWIDNTSGAVTPLPGVASALSSYGFLTLLWRPGSSQALAATMYPSSYGMKYFLLDMAQDTATPLGLSGSPEAWTPDGSALIIATGSQQPITEDSAGFNDIGEIGAGPFALSALPVSPDGWVGHASLLTTHAMTIPTLGFIHTA